MKAVVCSIVLLFFGNYCKAQQIAKLPFGAKHHEELTIYVHPGTELMIIVQLLAEKYSDPNPSSYYEAMKVWFTPFKDHAAVKYLESFRSQLYPDFVELGWCFDNFPDITVYAPDDIHWYRYYGKDSVIQYLNLVKQFYKDSKFWDFYSQYEEMYSKWGEEVKKKIIAKGTLTRLYSFYNNKQKGKWYIGIEPLNAWGSHAIPHIKSINEKYKEYTIYETGYFSNKATKSSEPSFALDDKSIEELLWHEGSHHMLRKMMDKYKKEIGQLSYLFHKEDEGLKRNNISNWEYCFEENVVRSVVACLIKKYSGDRKYEKEIDIQDYSDFLYVKPLAPFINDVYLHKNKYKNFDEFFPEILMLLAKKFKSRHLK